jgi:hypothetical protein
MSAPLGSKQFAFTVPAGAGSYAPEILYTTATGLVTGTFDWFDRLLLLIAAITATAQVEVDLLRPGFDPAGGDASYYLAGAAGIAAITTVGYKGNVLGTGLWTGWWGARVRAKSGGTGGTTTIGAIWGNVN